MTGFLNVLKAPGMTSSDVVVSLRRILGIKKIGHTGTLDPGAAGVLSVAVGKATRAIEYAADVDKAYRCRLILGYITDTDDLEGKITTTHSGPLPSLDDVVGVIDRFIGDIQQTPPAYSAIKIDGKRAYKLAREGNEVSIPSRQVTVHSIKVLRKTGEGQYDLDITCGKGVYIRSLCRDIGEALGCGGTMGYLVRTRNGSFDIDTSMTLEEIQKSVEENRLKTIDMEDTLTHLPAITWPEHYKTQAMSGRPLPLDAAPGGAGEQPVGVLYRMYCGPAFMGIGAIQATVSGPVVRFRKMLAD